MQNYEYESEKISLGKVLNFLICCEEVARVADRPTCPGPTKTSAETSMTAGGSLWVGAGAAKVRACPEGEGGGVNVWDDGFLPGLQPCCLHLLLPRLRLHQREDYLWTNPEMINY